MNNDKSLFPFLEAHSHQPIQSIFDLESNFFFEPQESPPNNFLKFFSNPIKNPKEDILQKRFYSNII